MALVSSTVIVLVEVEVVVSVVPMLFAGIVVAANSAGAAELTGSELAPAAKFAGAAEVPGAAVGWCIVIIWVS